MLRLPTLLLAAAVFASCADPAKVLELRLVKARANLAQRQYDQALAAFDRVLELEPRHREALRSKAEVLFNTERFEEAAVVLEGVYRESPRDGGVVQDLARVRCGQGRWAEALKLLELLPEAARTRTVWAEALSGAGRHDDAANVIGALLIEDPWDETGYYQLSRIEHRRGRAKAAELWGELHRLRRPQREAEQRARQLDSQGHPQPARLARAQWLLNAGRWQPGAEQLEQALKAHPDDPNAQALMGVLLMELGHAPFAEKWLAKAVAAQPGHAEWEARLQAVRKRRADTKDEVTPILKMARACAKAGDLVRARALALYFAQRDPREAPDLVVQWFDRPADAFIRLWALRRVAKVAKDDTAVVEAIRAECKALRIREP
ncbi:MAG: tetratricopeptide repeat protein [Planctomycetes bacterium]|nr:tetratricopeptide repeat protein [Planctomycetota bacterium]MCB9869587.1 tetratricopeptide repeat protein [Planctomycetota bacterium]MCB9889860.1 tetratricopeptide repeat protein [Planctomycetota bacterium]